MFQKIWYCTEDCTIYPDRATAWDCFLDWMADHALPPDLCKKLNISDEISMEDLKKTFEECYKEVTFSEYNMVVLGLI